jgi:hypothetical protein
MAYNKIANKPYFKNRTSLVWVEIEHAQLLTYAMMVLAILRDIVIQNMNNWTM